MELGALNLWENLIIIFGNIYLLILVLFLMFGYFAIKSDINKWALLSFLGLFFLWVGYEVNLLFVFIFIIAIVAMVLEIIRRFMK